QRNPKKEQRPSSRTPARARDGGRERRDHDAEIEAFVGALGPEQQRALRALQQLVARTAPQATPMMRWAYPSWVGYGDLCYVSAHSRHVNLGFHRGSELRDPAGLLQGTGKGMRHVKLPLGDP